MHRIVNYGSALQAYATVKILSNMGFESKIIDYQYPSDYHFFNIITHGRYKNNIVWNKLLLLSSHFNLLLKYKSLKRALFHFKEWKNYILLKKRFNKWRKCFCPQTRSYSRQSILAHPPIFDGYVTGSDQTFKAINLGNDFTFLLDFAPEKALRIAYSASFGSAEFPSAFIKDYAVRLQNYHAISVREASGQTIVQQLCGKHAELVLDPSMLLSEAEWLSISAPNLHADRDYCLCYLLRGVFMPFPLLNNLIKKIYEISGLELVFIGEITPKSKDFPPYHAFTAADPSEFIALYSKAKFVLTNSFHGTAFALNFKKPFLAITPPQTLANDDRIISLLERLNLSSRGIPADNIEIMENELSKDLFSLNYKDIPLEYWQKKSLAFLHGNLVNNL